MVTVSKHSTLTRVCLYCGPRDVFDHGHKYVVDPEHIPCPTCGFDNGEIKMIENVRELGFEECYRREVRETR